jgi:hypothetical protein
MWSIRDAGADNDTGIARVQMCAAVWCAKMSNESRAHIKRTFVRALTVVAVVLLTLAGSLAPLTAH